MFFYTFLDASKAFDRVNYCKLFRTLVERGLPPCIMTPPCIVVSLSALITTAHCIM